VKEGGGAEGECEKECALGVLLCHSLGHCGTREEPGTLTQGAPVCSSLLGIELKTPGWLVQDPTTRGI
jgi:hypothetical protein